MFSEIEESYPGYSEDIKMAEYEDIKKVINERYGTNSTSLEIRNEFEIAFNKLFANMIKIYPDRLFDVIFVMMDEFNITESKAIRCLNNDHRELIRNFAMGKYHTSYYIKQERKAEKEKMKRLGKPYYEFNSISDFFS